MALCCNSENMLPDSVTVVRVSAIVAMIIINLRPCESYELYDPVPTYLSALNQINLERDCAIYCQTMKEFSQYSLTEMNECICLPSNTAALKNPFETSTVNCVVAATSSSPAVEFDQNSLIDIDFEQIPPMSTYNDIDQSLIQPQVFQPANYGVYFISPLGMETKSEDNIEPQLYDNFPILNRIAFDEPFENIAGNDYSKRGISYKQYMEPALKVYPEESIHYTGITGEIPQYIEERAAPYYNYYEDFSNDDRREIHNPVFKNEHVEANILSQPYNTDLNEINTMHGSKNMLENNLVDFFKINEQNNENIVGSPLKDSMYIPQYSKSDHVFDESIFANGKSQTFPTHYESLKNLHNPKVPHSHEIESNSNKHNHILHTPTIMFQTNDGGKPNTFPKIITMGDHINTQPITDFDNITMLNNSIPNTLKGNDPNIFQSKPFQKISEHNSEINFLSNDNDFGFPKSRFANKFFDNLKQKPTTLVQSPAAVHSTDEKNKFQILNSTDSKEALNMVNVSITPLRVQEKNVKDFILTRANNYGVTMTTEEPLIQMIHIGSEAGTSTDQTHFGNGHVKAHTHETLGNDLQHVLSIQNNYDNKIIIYSPDNLPTKEITSINLVKAEKHFVAEEISKDHQNIHNSLSRLNLELNQDKISVPLPAYKQNIDSTDKTDTIALDIEKTNQLSQLSYILTDEEVDTLPTLTKKDANAGVAEDEKEDLNDLEENYTDDELDSLILNGKTESKTIQENMFHDKLSKIFMDNIDDFKDSSRVEVSQQIYLRIGKLFLPMYSVATGVDKVDLVLDGIKFCQGDMEMFADNTSDDFLDIVNFVCKQIKTD